MSMCLSTLKVQHSILNNTVNNNLRLKFFLIFSPTESVGLHYHVLCQFIAAIDDASILIVVSCSSHANRCILTPSAVLVFRFARLFFCTRANEASWRATTPFRIVSGPFLDSQESQYSYVRSYPSNMSSERRRCIKYTRKIYRKPLSAQKDKFLESSRLKHDISQ